MDPFSASLTCVLCTFSGMLLVSYTGLFDNVELEIGLQHYAEQAWLPFCSFMPLNTLINLGYIGLGLYWCGMTYTISEQGVFKHKDSVLFYTFNIMSTVYGCVQLLRIVTQDVIWAILDQWCTLPFFALLFVWAFYFTSGWSSTRTVVIMSISILSYALSLCFTVGFEIALGIHITGAIIAGVMAYTKYPAQECLGSFFLALISCSGFVVLKLLDHKLAEMSFIFRYVSGHFLSKICDVGQIYFVNNFFLDLTLEKAADISVKEKETFLKEFDSNGYFQKQLSNDIMYEIPGKSKAI